MASRGGNIRLRGGNVRLGFECFSCHSFVRFPCAVHFHMYCPEPVDSHYGKSGAHHVHRYCEPCKGKIDANACVRDIWCKCEKGARGSRLPEVEEEETEQPAPKRERFIIRIKARPASSAAVAKGAALLVGEHGGSVARGDAEIGEERCRGEPAISSQRGPGGQLRIADKVGAPETQIAQGLCSAGDGAVLDVVQ